MDVTVKPSRVSGQINAPPSKSYAHRYLIASFLSGENCKIQGVGQSKDVFATLNALSGIGLKYTVINGDVTLERKEMEDNPVLDCSESGSTIRFLIPVASALGVKCRFSGSQRLLERPMGDIIDCLNKNGADIDGLTLNGKLHSGIFTINGGVSSQFITGLLLALPILNGDSKIVVEGNAVSRDYINITLDVLSKFQIKIERTQDGFFVKGNQKYVCPKEMTVEGDYSGCAFLFSMGAIGGDVEVRNLNVNSAQGDKKTLEILEKFGAKITKLDDGYRVSKGNLKGVTIDAEDIPDVVQVLSVVASYAEGKSVFQNVSRLVIKESDRIQGIINNLKLAGITCEYSDGNLTVYGGKPHGNLFQGDNDHRTVMSATVTALFADGQSTVIGAEAINKSYPSFFKDVRLIGGEIVGDI